MFERQNAVFGPTEAGVPSPLVPHTHPYPTRYHGLVNNYPRFGLPYQQATYARVPYAGLGGCGGCGMQPVGGTETPDGLGADDSATWAVTGVALALLFGGVVGVAVAPRSASMIGWGVAGAAANLILGPLGLAGVAAVSLAQK